jgi:hypothetical protein
MSLLSAEMSRVASGIEFDYAGAMTLRTVLNLPAPLFKKDAPRRIDRVIDYFEGRAPALTRTTVSPESPDAAAAS